jgi:hypothetical protein
MKPYFSDMLSMPTANPMSMAPLRIWLAIVLMAMSPLEQNLFTTWTGVVSGKPAARAAARAVYGASGVSTVPTQMSPTSLGSNFDWTMECYNSLSILSQMTLEAVNATDLKDFEQQLVCSNIDSHQHLFKTCKASYQLTLHL